MSLQDTIRTLGDNLTAREWVFATAESCTGGLIGKLVTDMPGSSNMYDCGFITYSNEAKVAMLGVSRDILARHGAVSAETACAMAAGARANSRAQIAVSCTGIAGPGGGSPEKPVGLVYIGIAGPGGFVEAYRHIFKGGRDDVRLQTAEAAFRHMQHYLEKNPA